MKRMQHRRDWSLPLGIKLSNVCRIDRSSGPVSIHMGPSLGSVCVSTPELYGELVCALEILGLTSQIGSQPAYKTYSLNPEELFLFSK
jgi:hypothetical protein